MRITNKIMQNNNLNNINNNKILQDKLSTQMSTEKKVNKPSDDPVVAIRALRLRSNVTEATQYYSKNIPDANSWLEITEGALKNTAQVLTNMIGQCTKGANGDLTSEDREIILEQLKALRDEVYSTANVDYAGRYVFAGYRTDTTISFTANQKLKYSVTEQLSGNAMDEVAFIKTTGAGGDLKDINSANFETINVSEQEVEAVKVNRIRLAYDQLDEGTIPAISHVTGKDADGNIQTEEVIAASDITMVHSYDVPSAFEQAAANDDKAYFIPETGELILGKNVYAKLAAYQDDISTSGVNEGEIRITYEKTNWEKGDLRPEHYFACTTTDDEGTVIDYNQEYLTGNNIEKQVIEYDVGFNQTIRVNTTADECFKPGIGREVDDLVKALEEVQALEKTATDIKTMIQNETDETKAGTLKSRLDAVNKALTLSKDKMQKMFEHSITVMQNYLGEDNLSITACGTRSSKLELIENRMRDQKTTYETLKSENEDVDITEAAIHLKSANVTYQAALMATGKVMQNSLLNYL